MGQKSSEILARRIRLEKNRVGNQSVREGILFCCPLILIIFRWDNFKVDIEDVTVHFVHQRSARPDAIALIIIHGWPGTFYEFHQLIEPLTNPPEGQPAFNLIIPSVPGFGFSSTPRKQGWTVKDTARIFDKLVTEVLGYKAYATQGGDWVSDTSHLCESEKCVA
jgi:Epoxide hydrolase N terminus